VNRGRLLRGPDSRKPVRGHGLLLPGHAPDDLAGRRPRRRPTGHRAQPAPRHRRRPRADGPPSEVTHLIYPHSHADLIGAAGLFGTGVVRISHAATTGLLARTADPNRPLPTVTFHDEYQLKVGGETLRLAYHTPDNIFIYAPEYATLMLIDVMYPGWAPFKDLAQSIAMDYPWQTFVGCHLWRLGVRADGSL
jgi:hypothetical protein